MRHPLHQRQYNGKPAQHSQQGACGGLEGRNGQKTKGFCGRLSGKTVEGPGQAKENKNLYKPSTKNKMKGLQENAQHEEEHEPPCSNPRQ